MEPTVPVEAAAAATEPPPAVPEPAEQVIREQDRLMPIANVVRVMRRVLPAHVKVADDAKEVIQECVSEFISFVTGEANDRCHGEHRKTVTAEDVVWAMERLGFDDYLAPIKAYLQRLRDAEGRGGGRGDRALAQARALPMPGPVAAVQGTQARPVAFPNTAPAHGYGVGMPGQVPFSVAPHFAARQVMVGGAAPLADGNNGGCGEETTSSSNEDPPAAGTALGPQ